LENKDLCELLKCATDANIAMADDTINKVVDFIEYHTYSYVINLFFIALPKPSQQFNYLISETTIPRVRK
jgi:hypothetical protein